MNYMKNIRIAAVISRSFPGKIQENLAEMSQWTSAAKAAGASLICFPEMNITGYSIREDIKELAEPVPGPLTQALSHLAVNEEMVILAGMAEKDEESRVFASHIAAKPDGSIEVYRKLHVAPPECPVFSAGSDVPVFEALGMTFGIQLCYDAHFPELSALMALKGAEVIFMPHASPRGMPEEKYGSWMRHLPARAYDNSLFVVACNQTGENGNGLSFPGLAMVLDPSGNVMAKDLSGKEGLLIADLDADALERVRNHPMRFFLPNRRADIFQKL
jgi:N-carbamoylputrescine amidase